MYQCIEAVRGVLSKTTQAGGYHLKDEKLDGDFQILLPCLQENRLN